MLLSHDRTSAAARQPLSRAQWSDLRHPPWRKKLPARQRHRLSRRIGVGMPERSPPRPGLTRLHLCPRHARSARRPYGSQYRPRIPRPPCGARLPHLRNQSFRQPFLPQRQSASYRSRSLLRPSWNRSRLRRTFRRGVILPDKKRRTRQKIRMRRTIHQKLRSCGRPARHEASVRTRSIWAA